jgi:hypothetical protein
VCVKVCAFSMTFAYVCMRVQPLSQHLCKRIRLCLYACMCVCVCSHCHSICVNVYAYVCMLVCVYACAATVPVAAQQVRANPLEFVDGDPTASSRNHNLAGASTHIYIYTYMHTHMLLHTHMHTDRHTCNTYVHICIQTGIHVGIHKVIRACIDS